MTLGSILRWSRLLIPSGFLLVLASVAGISLLAHRNSEAYAETERWVQHTHISMERLDALLGQLVDVETGVRGFVITGDERYLAAYDGLESRLQATIAELRAMLADNPAQLRNLDQLGPMIERKLRAMSSGIALRRTQGLEAVVESSKSGEGRIAMDEIRARIADMKAVESRVLGLRQDASRRGSRRAIITIWIGCAAAISLGLACGALLIRQTRLRERAEADRDRFFSSAIDLMCIAGMDGYFQRINPAFSRILGHSEQVLLTNPFMSFVHPDDVEATTLLVARLGAGDVSSDFQNRYRCLDGSWRWIQWTASADVRKGLIFANGRDVTEGKRLQAELVSKQVQVETALAAEQRSLAETRRNAAALERSNRELKEFAHVASHDLQEPLRMVTSYCSMLAENYRGRLDADADEFIGHAVDGAKRMQGLILDLLAYSRLDGTGADLADVAMASVVEDALANLQAAISESGAAIGTGDLPVLRADRRQMVQLVQNLVGNAIKYRSDKPPLIRIAAARSGNAWGFAVTDNGIGIASRHHARIFGLFKRLHGRDRYPGTGIGLSICQKIVETHGGRIWVESTLGEGSSFRFTIPDPAVAVAGSDPARTP